MAKEEFDTLETEIRTVQEAATRELRNAGSPKPATPGDDVEMDEDLDEEQAHALAEAITESIDHEPSQARAARVAVAKSRLQKQGKVVYGIVAKKSKVKRGSCG